MPPNDFHDKSKVVRSLVCPLNAYNFLLSLYIMLMCSCYTYVKQADQILIWDCKSIVSQIV